jgi:hypothetical protein
MLGSFRGVVCAGALAGWRKKRGKEKGGRYRRSYRSLLIFFSSKV